MINYIEFFYDDVHLVAAGPDEAQLPIYRLSRDDTNWVLYGSKMLYWPSWLKFLDEDDVRVVREGTTEDYFTLQQLLNQRELMKAPPGPPPRADWVWHEETRRWRNPENWEEVESHTPSVMTEWPYRRLSERIRPGEGFTGFQMVQIAIDIDESFDPKQAPSYVSPNQVGAIYEYAGTAYRSINRALRQGVELSGGLLEIYDAMYGAMRPLEQAQVVYRGMGRMPDVPYEVGKEYSLDAFTSTSRAPAMPMEAFAGLRNAVFMELDVPGDVWGMTLDSDEFVLDEDETILAPGQTLMIDSVEEVWFTTAHNTFPIHYIKGTVKP